MPNITATEARRKFGKVLDDAQRDPVVISKDGKLTAVVLSMGALKTIIGRGQPSGVRPVVEELLAKSIERHAAVYAALAKLD